MQLTKSCEEARDEKLQPEPVQKLMLNSTIFWIRQLVCQFRLCIYNYTEQETIETEITRFEFLFMLNVLVHFYFVHFRW